MRISSETETGFIGEFEGFLIFRDISEHGHRPADKDLIGGGGEGGINAVIIPLYPREPSSVAAVRLTPAAAALSDTSLDLVCPRPAAQ